MKRIEIGLLGTILLTLPEIAHANDLLFSMASFTFVLHTFALWFLFGM